VDYPIEHLKSICNKAGGLDTPILRRWLATREPQLFEAEFPWEETPPEWLEQFRHHDLRNTAAHAVYDSERCIGTYINFHRIPGRLGPGHIEALKLLAPIMHDVICRLIGDMNEASKLDKLRATLSEGERQVLELVARGKVNAEIASVLSISEDAVKHRVTRIFKKFGIENRIQLTRLCVEHEFRMQTEYGLKVR
jgi:ATP/maltotriose-dependent transcriptional regulator MalT